MSLRAKLRNADARTMLALSGALLLEDYMGLLTEADLRAIDGAALTHLKERGGAWQREDVCLSWTTAVVVQLMRKGFLKSLESLDKERNNNLIGD